MKLLTTQKLVDFHGLQVWVPSNSNWLISTAFGDVYATTKKPNIKGSRYPADAGSSTWVGEVDLEGMDWRDTLVEAVEVEPISDEPTKYVLAYAKD